MKRYIYWLFAAPIGLLVLLFALSNRAEIDLLLWPLPFELVGVPIFAPILLAFVGGFMIGGVLIWLSGHRWRAQARDRQHQVASLQRQVEDLKRNTQAMQVVRRAAEATRGVGSDGGSDKSAA